MFALRDYQRAAVDAVHSAWANGVNRPAVVLPTGAGKTVVFSHLVKEWLDKPENVGKRVVVMAHRKELVEQAYKKIKAVAPELSVGIVKGNRNETLARVCVTCVPTLRSKSRLTQLRNVGMVVIDECHHGTASTYVQALEYFGSMVDGGTPTVGFTATLVRGDGTALGDVWQTVAYVREIGEMIDEGHLVRPRGVRVKVDDFRLDKVHKQNGDLAAGEVGAALEASMAPRAIAEAYVEHAYEKQGILFAPTVSSAELIADHLNAVDIKATVIHGAMPDSERGAALKAFEAGEIQVLCNCMVLTEGTDLPMAEVAVIARPTLNEGLYIQMVGRVLRPHPGKDGALIIDVAGATGRHALVSPVTLTGEDETAKADGEPEEPEDGEFRSAEGGGREEREQADGPIVSFEVDLFRRGGRAWNRTRAGVWFISAGQRYIAIVGSATPNRWDVVTMHAVEVGKSAWVGRGFASLADAMNAGECDVMPHENMTANAKARWRNGASSEKQRAYARRLGISVGELDSAGTVSDRIAVALASNRIDPLLKPYMITNGASA